MAKRFSRLKYALSTLRKPTASETDPLVTPEAGTILANYKDFYTKAKFVSYTREEASKPGTLDDINIIPFFLGSAGNIGYKIIASNRSLGLQTLAATKTACNHQANNAAGLTFFDAPIGFKPAKVIVRVKASGSVKSTETSKITGIKYTKTPANSYTLPYGVGDTNKTENEVRSAIAVAAAAISGFDNVNFISEVA